MDAFGQRGVAATTMPKPVRVSRKLRVVEPLTQRSAPARSTCTGKINNPSVGAGPPRRTVRAMRSEHARAVVGGGGRRRRVYVARGHAPLSILGCTPSAHHLLRWRVLRLGRARRGLRRRQRQFGGVQDGPERSLQRGVAEGVTAA